jgi:hypothetical protein
LPFGGSVENPGGLGKSRRRAVCGIKVFFTGAIYDDAAFEQDGQYPDCFQLDQIVESELQKDDARISTDPQCRL